MDKAHPQGGNLVNKKQSSIGIGGLGKGMGRRTNKNRVWEDGSEFKNTYCFCRGLGSVSKPLVTPVSVQDLVLFSGFQGCSTHVYTPSHIPIIKNSKNKSLQKQNCFLHQFEKQIKIIFTCNQQLYSCGNHKLYSGQAQCLLCGHGVLFDW